MRFLCFIIAAFPLLVLYVAARRSDKHDLGRLPFDLRPVRWLIGRWRLESVSGNAVALKPPDILDFGINPIPLFGARAVNITGHYHSRFNQATDSHTMYGYMPVKNATRRDPRIHTAFITTFSDGINVIEQGLVDPGRKSIQLHLKQFMKRSFGLATNDDFYIDRLDRQILVSRFGQGRGTLTMSIHSETTAGSRTQRDDYTATYARICDSRLFDC